MCAIDNERHPNREQLYQQRLQQQREEEAIEDLEIPREARDSLRDVALRQGRTRRTRTGAPDAFRGPCRTSDVSALGLGFAAPSGAPAAGTVSVDAASAVVWAGSVTHAAAVRPSHKQ